MARYEAERVEKQELIRELAEKLSQTAKSERDIETYLERIRKYAAAETLDREMLLELICGYGRVTIPFFIKISLTLLFGKGKFYDNKGYADL